MGNLEREFSQAAKKTAIRGEKNPSLGYDEGSRYLIKATTTLFVEVTEVF